MGRNPRRQRRRRPCPSRPRVGIASRREARQEAPAEGVPGSGRIDGRDVEGGHMHGPPPRRFPGEATRRPELHDDVARHGVGERGECSRRRPPRHERR